jgi:hypothetical protein
VPHTPKNPIRRSPNSIVSIDRSLDATRGTLANASLDYLNYDLLDMDEVHSSFGDWFTARHATPKDVEIDNVGAAPHRVDRAVQGSFRLSIGGQL